MKKYHYQIIRYIHDRVTDEFVNVGIVVFFPESKAIESRVINKYSRITKFFNDINGPQIISSLKHFQKAIEKKSSESSELFFPFKSIREITESILPKDDSSLQLTDVFQGIDINIQSATDDLFGRLVNQYVPEIEKESVNDNEVWKKSYKEFFDKYNISKKLVSHSIKTKNDKIEFDKSWKNGSWHCYQSLSFDLKKVESIKNKVYKWSGILNELENSDEMLHLYLLTAESKRHKSINKFVIDTFSNRDTENVKVTLVKEKDAEKFAKEVVHEIQEHDSL